MKIKLCACDLMPGVMCPICKEVLEANDGETGVLRSDSHVWYRKDGKQIRREATEEDFAACQEAAERYVVAFRKLHEYVGTLKDETGKD